MDCVCGYVCLCQVNTKHLVSCDIDKNMDPNIISIYVYMYVYLHVPERESLASCGIFMKASLHEFDNGSSANLNTYAWYIVCMSRYMLCFK